MPAFRPELRKELTPALVQLKMTLYEYDDQCKELRASLPEVVEKVRRGARFTVLYRSRPAFQVVPMDAATGALGDLKDDPLYHAKPLGRSTTGGAPLTTIPFCTPNERAVRGHSRLGRLRRAADPAYNKAAAARDAWLQQVAC